jgi:hypothetical protein
MFGAFDSKAPTSQRNERDPNPILMGKNKDQKYNQTDLLNRPSPLYKKEKALRIANGAARASLRMRAVPPTARDPITKKLLAPAGSVITKKAATKKDPSAEQSAAKKEVAEAKRAAAERKKEEGKGTKFVNKFV